MNYFPANGDSKRNDATQIAFTMLEVMVAVAIFGMVLIAIYASWSAILRASKSSLAAAADAQRMRVAMRAFEESLGATELFLENPRFYSFIADTSGDFAAASFVSYLPPTFPGSGLFPEQSIRRVMFNVERGKKGQNELILSQTPLLEPPETSKEPYRIVLAPDVRLFKMFFWDTNKAEWAEEWLWTNRLPRMVRVQLAVGDPNRRLVPDDIAVKTVFIASAAIPREAQVPANRGVRPGVGGSTNITLPPTRTTPSTGVPRR